MNITNKTNEQLMALRSQILDYINNGKDSVDMMKERLNIIEKEIRSRVKKSTRVQNGNALIIMGFVPKKTKDDILVACVLRNIYTMEELKDKGYRIPRDKYGKIIWI